MGTAGIVPANGSPGQAATALADPGLLCRGADRARFPGGCGAPRARPVRGRSGRRTSDGDLPHGSQPGALRPRNGRVRGARHGRRCAHACRRGAGPTAPSRPAPPPPPPPPPPPKSARPPPPEPLEDRPGQPVYSLERPPKAGETELRAARLDDLDALVAASAAAYLEEVGVDAYARDPALFEWRTRVQIEEGRSWLWSDGEGIRFKAEASAWTERAVQLQQVWVDPDLRGRGYGKRGLADLCRLLLARTPAVCLFVRPDNAPAIALYEGIGMRRTIAYRSLIFG